MFIARLRIVLVQVMCKASYTRACQMVCEPNARMCRWDCKPALHHLQMVRISFTTNRNLSVFCANTKRTGCVGCPFHTLGVLCSSQVCGKLMNRSPNMRHMLTVQRVSGALVYTRFKGFSDSVFHILPRTQKHLEIISIGYHITVNHLIEVPSILWLEIYLMYRSLWVLVGNTTEHMRCVRILIDGATSLSGESEYQFWDNACNFFEFPILCDIS